MKALILSAGQGTRLGHLTAARPKPMLPIGGRPLLEHTIRWLRGHGIRELAINLHYLPGEIVEYFGDGASLGVSITYSIEESLMGTAGAVKRLEGFLDEPFVVVYGDVLTNIDLAQLHGLHEQNRSKEELASIATIALYRVPNPTECGLIELGSGQRVTGFVEKPMPEDVRTDLAFSGVMVCEPQIAQLIPDGVASDFGFDVFPKLLERGLPFYGQPLAAGKYVIDIGTMPGYLRALALQWNQTGADSRRAG